MDEMRTQAPAPVTASGDAESRGRGFLHLSAVYLIWGSTYLGIRIAVREGSGFPPFTMAALRVVAGGAFLLLWARHGGARLRLTRSETALLAVTGTMLWLGGNGLVTWAEQWAHSSYAALLIGTAPLWMALFEAVVDRRAPTLLLVASILTGFGGVALLTLPGAEQAAVDPRSVAALVVAPISWAGGTLLLRRRSPALGTRVVAGYQQLFGGVGFMLAALATHEPPAHPATDAWVAWAYLTVFGSVIAFTSYVRALHLLPTRVVMTYAYVNPVVAVMLGRVVLNEPITPAMLGGMALVLAGVAGVFRDRYAH